MAVLTELDDDRFLAAVAVGDEPCSHAANVRLGLLLLRAHGRRGAASRMLELIVRRADERGGLVHVTKTVAWLALIAESGEDHDGDSASFLDAHPHLLDGTLLERFYDPATLAGLRSHAEVVAPDRAAIGGFHRFRY